MRHDTFISYFIRSFVFMLLVASPFSFTLTPLTVSCIRGQRRYANIDIPPRRSPEDKQPRRNDAVS